MRIAALLVALALSGCAGSVTPRVAAPAPGVTLIVEGAVEAAPGHHLVMGEIFLGPAGLVPRHRHSGEEFITVLEGSVTLRRDGVEDLVLTLGQGVRIAPGVPHSATAGEHGFRGVSSWIVVNGQPLREALPE